EQSRRRGTLAQPLAIQHRAMEDVQATEVKEMEWTHRPVQALLDSDVDVLRTGVTTLKKAHRLFRSGEQDAVDDETPDLFFQQDRRAIDAADELHRGGNGVV